MYRRGDRRGGLRVPGGSRWLPSALGSSVIVWFHAERSTITIVTGVSEISNLGSDGAALKAVQATTTKQPAWLAAATPNGKHALDFDGTNDAMKTAQRGAALAQPFTLIAVAKSDVTIAGKTMIDGDNNAGNRTAIMRDAGAPANVYQGYAGSFVNSQTTTLTDWHGIVVEFNGASSRVILDNGTPATGTIGAETYRGTTLGAFVDQATAPFDGKIAEFLVVSRLLSAGELSALYAYQRSEWGI